MYMTLDNSCRDNNRDYIYKYYVNIYSNNYTNYQRDYGHITIVDNSDYNGSCYKSSTLPIHTYKIMCIYIVVYNLYIIIYIFYSDNIMYNPLYNMGNTQHINTY